MMVVVFCTSIASSLVLRPFPNDRGADGSGDSGQDVVTQWNAIMDVLGQRIDPFCVTLNYAIVYGIGHVGW